MWDEHQTVVVLFLNPGWSRKLTLSSLSLLNQSRQEDCKKATKNTPAQNIRHLFTVKVSRPTDLLAFDFYLDSLQCLKVAK